MEGGSQVYRKIDDLSALGLESEVGDYYKHGRSLLSVDYCNSSLIAPAKGKISK